MVEEEIVKNVRLVIDKAEEEKIAPRGAALKIAQKRVKETMEKREKVENT